MTQALMATLAVLTLSATAAAQPPPGAPRLAGGVGILGTNARDVVLTFGGAGGVTYAFSRRWPRLDVSWRYMRGGTARYLTGDAIRVENGQAVYDFKESRTDSVSLYIGLAWPR